MTSPTYAGPAVRKPRKRLLANGVPMAGVHDARVVSNNHLSADTWHATVALPATPTTTAASAWFDPPQPPDNPGGVSVPPVDYIHFNPVKRGLAANAADWPFFKLCHLCKAWHVSERLGDVERLIARRW